MAGLCVACWLGGAAQAAGEPQYFGVINQRSLALTAGYWNPILGYVSDKSGVPLRLKMGKTASETTAMTVRGEHAFVYTNHLFSPERDRIGYRVILRMQGGPVNGAIVVPEDSPLKSLKQLSGQVIAFPSPESFLGYWVPMEHLLRSGIKAKPVFSSNEEGAIAQLQVGKVDAAGVNEQVLMRYARREGFRYRVLWASEPYLDIPIMAHPALAADKIEAVRQAFLAMAQGPDGQAVLRASAALIGQQQPIVFVRADDRDYDAYRRFYRHTRVRSGP
jgi:phosphonate transport system substrate-binding protein